MKTLTHSSVFGRWMHSFGFPLLCVALTVLFLLIPAVAVSQTQAPVDMGTTANFSILAYSTVTSENGGVVHQDLGLSPNTSVTGFPPATVLGTMHVADAVASQAQTDWVTAYNDAVGRSNFVSIGAEIGGLIIPPGAYQAASSLGITGTLTLDGEGNPDAVWIFKIPSTLITAGNSNIVLTNGASACNVFWAVGSSATLGTYSNFKGNILATVSITQMIGVSVEGRLLAHTGAVTFDGSAVTEPGCTLGVPQLDIEKATNGEDADSAPGPYVVVGSTVTWTYVVTNNGNVPFSDITVTDDVLGVIGTITSLAAGADTTLTRTGIAALGQYENMATATTTYIYDGEVYSDSDLSHYFGATPSLDIEKATNGVDADLAPGPQVLVGSTVTWTFVVTNTGNVTLTNIGVVDDRIGAIGTILSLEPGMSSTLETTGVAAIGQYENTATATAFFGGLQYTDSDMSHYFASLADASAIDLEKATNGFDADLAPGPTVAIGSTVTWTYVVTNAGNIGLMDILVVDDKVGTIGTISSLAVGASATLTKTGIAVVGQYENTGTATATDMNGRQVSDTDLSHYFAAAVPDLDIEKATNGEDADLPTGPYVAVGSTVTWTFVVTNTGNVALIDILVVDDVVGTIGTISSLAPGADTTLTKTGVALAGQYENTATATATYGNEQLTDSDMSHYFGTGPSIDIEKATNGEDADAGPGPLILEGNNVTWTYVVTNTGNVTLYNIAVNDDKIGSIGVIDSLVAGEVRTLMSDGIAQFGQYANLGTAIGWYGQEQVSDSDSSHYVGELFQDVPPDDFVVALSFKDRNGDYVGGVIAILTRPGEKNWKVESSSNERMLWNKFPYNALFRGLFHQLGGLYQFKFFAPTGYKFVSPDHMEIQVPANEHFYSTEGHTFILEKIAGGDPGDDVTPPDAPNPPDIPVFDNRLMFVQGTPTYDGQGWEKAIDGVVEGWNGTTTAKADQSGTAWAIFGFSDGRVYQFNYVTLQTDNGPKDDAWVSRQAVLVDILTSQTGTQPEDFTAASRLRIKYSALRWYALGKTVQAKYVKLVILEPKWGQGGYRQVVEFGVNSDDKLGAVLAKQDAATAAVPTQFNLDQNFPNPFNPVTTISYTLPEDVQVKLTIFDVTGREVAVLTNEFQSKGAYSVQWIVDGNPSGLYFYHISAGSFNKTLRMILLK